MRNLYDSSIEPAVPTPGWFRENWDLAYDAVMKLSTWYEYSLRETAPLPPLQAPEFAHSVENRDDIIPGHMINEVTIGMYGFMIASRVTAQEAEFGKEDNEQSFDLPNGDVMMVYMR